MSKLDTVLQNWSDPSFWRGPVAQYVKVRTLHPFFHSCGDLYWWAKRADFVDYYQEDWDNLLILDACRFDLFRDVWSGPGSVESRLSGVPDTSKWLERNFEDRICHDTVVVTANPHYQVQLDDKQFHEVYHVWQTHWDDDTQTVRPEAISDVVAQAAADHPQKRLLIHYLQPHAPFIGEWAQQQLQVGSGNKSARERALTGSFDGDKRNVYWYAEAGEISDAMLQQAYRENLEMALQEVERLLPELDGRTVVSSDHGELLGDRAWPFVWRRYQHPPFRARQLLRVPWCTIETDSRKTVTSEAPATDHSESQSEDIDSKLEHLGYL